MADPEKWFLPFDGGGDGRPWGDGTTIAARGPAGKPWDLGNKVTPLLGGFEAMVAIRDAFEVAISAAAGVPADQKGHVYIAGWRVNSQRDLSDANPWGTHAWDVTSSAVLDQTAIGLIFRLMQAGVRVRIAVWWPTWVQRLGKIAAHIEDHFFLADAVSKESARLAPPVDPPIGVVALDLRTAEGSIAGAHHQKMMVFRGPTQNVAFCGGVDLAFTRRDAPPQPNPGGVNLERFQGGDWQSGNGIPTWLAQPHTWPRDVGHLDYATFDSASPPRFPEHKQASDLPERDPGDPASFKDVYGFTNQIWHDQHLKLEGPIVQTLEEQFRERWRDSAPLFDLSKPDNTFGGHVIFSSSRAIGPDKDIVPLPDATEANVAGGASPVQIWRTIPWRNNRTRPPFLRGEFTVMTGVNHAIQQSEHFIWIFDQYFWSLPLARQLNFELNQRQDLRLIVILPPYADSQYDEIHEARRRALDELGAGGLADPTNPDRKAAIYGLWDPRPPGGRGIYCHAKVQMYDGSLLVCGSANMNRRSFVCDSELSCAIADEDVLAAHQQRLWNLLFGEVPGPLGQWPAPDFTQTDSGSSFFAKFTAAAAHPNSYLTPDPWVQSDPQHLPNGVPVTRSGLGSAWASFMILNVLDPSSLDVSLLERSVEFRDANGNLQTRPARLDDVVNRVDTTEGDTGVMPNRRQNSIIRISSDDVKLESAL